MRYKVINKKIVEQVNESYVPPSYPQNFPEHLKETIIECSNLGTLTLLFPTTILIFQQTLGDYIYTYENQTVIDNTPIVRSQIKANYHQALANSIKKYLNGINLNEEKIYRKYMLYLTDTGEPSYAEYKTNFDTYTAAVDAFIAPYQSELDDLSNV